MIRCPCLPEISRDDGGFIRASRGLRSKPIVQSTEKTANCGRCGQFYAVKVSIDGLLYKGVANLGIRPTFGQSSPLLEVHLFDYSGDLYGNDIVISFIDFIREEKKFDGIKALKKQIEIDSTKAIELIIEN